MSSSPGAPSTAAVPVVAVDTGGTFTDLVAWRAGEVRVLKVPSTPEDPAQAILDGLERVLDPGEPFVLMHGSTVATNALLERKGARVALITNEGFEDVLAIGRQDRPQLYALVGRRPPPLVPEDRRLGIAGRIGPRGEEMEPLDRPALARLPERLGEVDAVAVTLLHSYAEPAHEEAVAQALSGLEVPLSVSSRILPEYREYERTSTTVVNAYVAPVMSRYLGRLARESGAERVGIMGSGGGTLAVERAGREPVHTVLSGPAGGVMGALAWARRAGVDHVLTFDMGGTSTDVSLCPGRPLHTREFQIDGQPVAIPVIDIHTVGAGGGSLASVDPGGALRVGPESAGAHPGPACYGRGGDRVTVTDAHAWLGRLPAEGFLGGAGSLDRDAVRGPLEQLAGELGLTPDQAAEGVLEVADTAMERALRVISVERGFDPRDFALVAFGGAGALHAAGLARRLGVSEVLIPPHPGLLSAHGILTAPPTREGARTLLLATDRPELQSALEEALEAVAGSARKALADEEDVDTDAVSVTRWVEARYRGQSFELRVPAEGWLEAFHRAHLDRYGYRRDEAAVEVVTVRAVATAPGLQAEPAPLPPADEPPGTARCSVIAGGRKVEARRCWRRELRPGHEIPGPAQILDYSSTVWVPGGHVLRVHPSGVLRLVRE